MCYFIPDEITSILAYRSYQIFIFVYAIEE